MQTGNLHVVPWHNDRLVVVLPQQHALLEREHLRLADLLNEPFVGMQYDSALQRLYRHQAEALGFPLHQRAHASSFESVRRMVEAGLGIAILPSVTVEPFTQSMRIAMRPLEEEWALRPSILCIRDPDNLPAAVRLLVHHLAHDHSPDALRETYIADKGMDLCGAVASYTGQRTWKVIPLEINNAKGQ
jgi:DNA-binding transcriptional LysR family regulator